MNNKGSFISSMKVDVLTSNGWDRIGYNVLRGLAKENLNVAFGTDRNLGMGYYSKYPAARYLHSDCFKDEDNFISDLNNSFKKFQPSVYMPIGDETIIVSQHISKLSDYDIKIPISDYTTLESLDNKSVSFKIAKSQNIPTPETIMPSCLEEIEDFAKKFSYPIVLKHIKSNSSKGVWFLSKENFYNVINEIINTKGINYGDFIVQQCVRGSGYGVSLLMNKGSLRAKFTHKRLRERIKRGGPSTLRISTENRELEEYAISLLSSVKFHGVAMVEFKYDEENEKATFIEVNPRFWGSVGLAINSGVNFPYLLYKMALNGDVEPVLNYKNGVVARWLLGNILSLTKDIFTTGYLLNMRSTTIHVDFNDDYYKDDRLPFWMWIFLLFRRKLKRIF
jgi:predicted ATP-grasp superfamily ATP-dependent carboligase